MEVVSCMAGKRVSSGQAVDIMEIMYCVRNTAGNVYYY